MSKRKATQVKTRNYVAIAAWNATGGGKHDTRPNRARTRMGAKRAAMREGE